MDLFFRTHFSGFSRKGTEIFLAFGWMCGLIFGAVTSVCASDMLFPAMRTAAFSDVSIIGLLSATVLPLLFSAFAVYISKYWLLIPIAFTEAFFFAYLGVGAMAAFGNAGWLVQCLLLFSDMAILPVLWLYWLNALHGSRAWLLPCSGAALVLAVAIGSLDYCLISPFLAQVLSI